MGPEALAQVLRPLTGLFDAALYPDLLRGLAEPDDAAVWRLDAERALVLTADFFPPVVDDPYAYGAIAATNALSDVYAMGAEPLFALNLASFPEGFDPLVIAEILRGGAEKVREAGAVVAGGHTTSDPEPKYGLAVTGIVHPDRVLAKGGARPGDVLLLTKPVGTGLVTTALKRDRVAPEDLEAATVSMTTLNREALRALRTVPGAVHALTDITGFGLPGHAHEMAAASGLALRIAWEAVPRLPGAERYAREGLLFGGLRRNRAYYGKFLVRSRELADWEEHLLHDPQTSGGLLAAVDPAALEATLAGFRALGHPVWRIGEAAAGDPGGIEIV